MSDSILLHPRVLRLRYELRRALDRLDDEDVRNARRLVRALRRTPLDVVYLGDSTTSFVAPEDRDRRPLHAMIADELAPDASIHSTFGGSYHADLLADLAGLLPECPSRPIVIVPLWIRGRYLPWIEHPVYGHQQAMAFLRELPRRTPTWRIRASFPRPAPAAFERFYQLRFPTLVGDLTIGDYVRPLKDPDRFREHPEERVKLIYAYHQGAALDRHGPEMAAVTRLGRVLRDLGVPVVAYQTPLSVQTGAEIYGPAFTELAVKNFAILDDAFREGVGEDVTIIQSGMAFPPDQFIDPRIADEHLNEVGRRRLTDLIVTRTRELLAAPVAS